MYSLAATMTIEVKKVFRSLFTRGKTKTECKLFITVLFAFSHLARGRQLFGQIYKSVEIFYRR